MIVKMWRRWRRMYAFRQSMGWMLDRRDDRFLDDIGMTRHEVRGLLQRWDK